MDAKSLKMRSRGCTWFLPHLDHRGL